MSQPLCFHTSQNLSSGALSFSLDLDYPVRLSQVLIHFSTNVTETVKVIYDSGMGSNYDTELDSTDLSSEANYVFRPSGRCVIGREDALKITCTNANGTGTAYVTVIVQKEG